MSQKYLAVSHPSLKETIRHNNYTLLQLALLVSEFAQQMAAVHELFSKEIQAVVETFKRRSRELKQQRPVDTPCTVITAWDTLLSETEMDAQAHLDAAGLLLKNVFRPLQEVASHKGSHIQQLVDFREVLEALLASDAANLKQVKEEYEAWFQRLVGDPGAEDVQAVRDRVLERHNDYVLQLQAANRTIQQFKDVALPEVLEELEEIYIDTSHTLNVAIEGHALLLLTKATEQLRRFEDQLTVCRQVNPQLDVTFFVKAVTSASSGDLDLSHGTSVVVPLHQFHAVNTDSEQLQMVLRNQIIVNESTQDSLDNRRLLLQRKGMEIASALKMSQERINSHVNVCQRNLAKHQYAKVYETQEDMCRKRNEIRIANLQLAAIKAQMEVLTQKQNGSVGEGLEAELETQEEKKEHTATIKGLWKKAFKSLKSGGDQKLPKKASVRRKDSKESEEPEPPSLKEIDPVYSLLKCAADLPKRAKEGGQPTTPQGAPCPGLLLSRHGDSSGSTSKASSPSSSGLLEVSADGTCVLCGLAHPAPVTPTLLGHDFKEFYKHTAPIKASAPIKRQASSDPSI